MYESNLHKQFAVGLSPVAEFSSPPRVISGLRHVEFPAHRHNWIALAIGVNESEFQRWFFAKKAFAFFKISLD